MDSKIDAVKWMNTASVRELLVFSAQCYEDAARGYKDAARAIRNYVGCGVKRLEIDAETLPMRDLKAITGDQVWFYALLYELREIGEKLDALTAQIAKGKKTSDASM